MTIVESGEVFADEVSRFLPNAGKYMLNVLNGKSNGEEKDKAWAWKPNPDESGQPRRELKEFELDSDRRSARL